MPKRNEPSATTLAVGVVLVTAVPVLAALVVAALALAGALCK